MAKAWWEGWERENNVGKLVGGMGKGEQQIEAGGRNGRVRKME